MRVLIDGVPVEPSEATISVFDLGLQRGDGVFEVARAYGGRLFDLEGHLARLRRSAAQSRLETPPLEAIAEWMQAVAADGGDCFVRCVVTRGGILNDIDAPARCIVAWEPLPEYGAHLRLLPIPAPWHSGGEPWDLMGAKTISYAPNMSTHRHAAEAGFDDALLVSRDGFVLEGPTFTVGWFVGEVFETPSLDLGILASITRAEALKAAVDIGVATDEGRFPIDRILAADEAVAMSTLKEILPITAMGDVSLASGPLSASLAAAFSARVEAALQ